jgi:hypothetical protein
MDEINRLLKLVHCKRGIEYRQQEGRSNVSKFTDTRQFRARTVAVFDDFCTANDPHGAHDFGEFDFDGVSIMLKIDYYDRDLNFHSENPADPTVTEG